MIKVGDVVVRKSYGGDLLFRVDNIDWYGNIFLVGIDFRIEADAPLEDLMPIEEFALYRNRKDNREEIENKMKTIKKKVIQSKSELERDEMIKTGKVLHIDGDANYLEVCMRYYKQLGVEAVGENIKESQQPNSIVALLQEHAPDILVITGHDSVSKEVQNYENIDNYRSSKYFIEAVKLARKFEPDMDQLVIFAGACQSYYEAILAAGANFASSPKRINIHALDPVIVVYKIAYASVEKILKINTILEDTFTGKEGVGGYETRGKMREGGPNGIGHSKS